MHTYIAVQFASETSSSVHSIGIGKGVGGLDFDHIQRDSQYLGHYLGNLVKSACTINDMHALNNYIDAVSISNISGI